MGLDEKRKKNNKSKNFINDEIEYDSLLESEIDNIRSKVFEGWIKSVGEELLRGLNDRE